MLHLHLHHATSLLAAIAQQPDYDQQAKAMGGMIAGMMGFILLFAVAIVVFFIFLFWRIFTKAGLNGALSLFILLYPIGFIIVVCILAFSDWKVVPAPTASPYYPPSYPPPPPPPAIPPAYQPPPQS
ncbi:hypothetical protein [Granulicella sp. 5B5]|uniref:hypothetical protein n=1 Tax=Granulicella sp. 5B5 TaxID=1617967 RepID=UPI0015F5E3C8|nr:hypothetical protein [Granulicella sp. 5B5]